MTLVNERQFHWRETRQPSSGFLVELSARWRAFERFRRLLILRVWLSRGRALVCAAVVADGLGRGGGGGRRYHDQTTPLVVRRVDDAAPGELSFVEHLHSRPIRAPFGVRDVGRHVVPLPLRRRSHPGTGHALARVGKWVTTHGTDQLQDKTRQDKTGGMTRRRAAAALTCFFLMGLWP